MLRETDLTLAKAVDICRASEVSRKQVKALGDKSPVNVDALRKDGQRDSRQQKTRDTKRERPRYQNKKTCGNCGRSHESKQCPGYGKTCNSCGKSGHFAKLCRSSKNRPNSQHNSHVQHLDIDGDISDHGIDEIQSHIHGSTNEHATLKINNKPIQLKLDSGVGTNILTKSDFEKVVPRRRRYNKLKSSQVKLTAFGGHPIPVIGKCYLLCTHQDSTRVVEFHVVEKGTSLLGCADWKSMQFITFNNIEQITSEKSSLSGLSSEQIFTKYAHCFEGLGRVSEPYHIKVNPTVTLSFTPLGNYLYLLETEFIANCRLWKGPE